MGIAVSIILPLLANTDNSFAKRRWSVVRDLQHVFACPLDKINRTLEDCCDKHWSGEYFKPGLANEVNNLSFLCPRWKSLKQRMQMGSPHT